MLLPFNNCPYIITWLYSPQASNNNNNNNNNNKWKNIVIKRFQQKEILSPSTPFPLNNSLLLGKHTRHETFLCKVFVAPWYSRQRFLYMRTLHTWFKILATLNSFSCKAFQFTWVGILATSNSFSCKAFQLTWVGIATGDFKFLFM